MNSGTLSCSDLCSIVEGHFSAAASIYSSKNSSEPELRDLVQREQDRFLCWAVEFEESDVLEGYFRYDKPALVSIRMTLENLGVALATLGKLSKRGIIKGLCSKLNPFSRSDKANIQTLAEDIVSENSMLQYLGGTAKQRADFAAGLTKEAAVEVRVEEVPVETDAAATDLTKGLDEVVVGEVPVETHAAPKGFTKGFSKVTVEEVQADEICLME